MHRILLPLAAAAALTAVSIVTAFAHAGLETAKAAPGAYKAVLRIPHGCDGPPTNAVTMVIPEGYVGVKPMQKPGWTIKTVKGDYAKLDALHGEAVSSGVTEVTWSGGDLPDDLYADFVVTGTLAGVEDGQTLYFDATQTCANGEVAWTGRAAAGQDAHALKHPALTILAAAAGGHDDAGHGAAADKTVVGDLEIAGGWARVMLPGQPTGGGYFSVTNKGRAPDRLLSVASPNAGRVEVHSMSMDNDVMVMRPVEGGLEIPAGATVELKPGGFHLMFMEVSAPFAQGASVPVTLEFEKAGKVDVTLPVKAAKP